MEEEGVYWFHRKKNHFFPKNMKGWGFTLTFVVLKILILLRLETHNDPNQIFMAITLIIALLGILLQVMHGKSSKYLVD